MTHEERLAVPDGTRVEYKRDGFVGFCTGAVVRRKARGSHTWVAIDSEQCGQIVWMRINRIMKVCAEQSRPASRTPVVDLVVVASEIRKLITRVEDRAIASDGPVPSTFQEMTLAERTQLEYMLGELCKKVAAIEPLAAAGRAA